MPEHSMQMSAPRFKLAHVGSGDGVRNWLPAEQTRAPTPKPHSLPGPSTAPLRSLGAPQSTQIEFPLAFRIAWIATASLWLSVRSCRKGWVIPDSPSEPFSRHSPLLSPQTVHPHYLDLAALTALQTG